MHTIEELTKSKKAMTLGTLKDSMQERKSTLMLNTNFFEQLKVALN